MTNEEQKQALADLKARQAKQERMPCPRCGRDEMDDDPMRNALSRHADVMVCDSCGTQEAMLDFMHNPLPLEQWAYFKTSSPEAEAAKAMSATNLMKLVMQEHISYLISLFERWQNEHEYEDFGEYIDAAKSRCPGLIELWPEPFRAVYQAANGKVVIRFRSKDGNTELAADITA